MEDHCDRWLAAWRGADAGPLLAFYADACAYRDPAKPEGLVGKEALSRYLRKLMRAYPDMDWRREELWAIDGGYVVRYRARVTVGGAPIEFPGMDLVLLDAQGRIARNDVYFDRAAWLEAAERDAARG